MLGNGMVGPLFDYCEVTIDKLNDSQLDHGSSTEIIQPWGHNHTWQ